jgi:hypothetical protein
MGNPLRPSRCRIPPEPEWRNGRRRRLKIFRRKAYGFESRLRHHLPTNNLAAFDPLWDQGPSPPSQGLLRAILLSCAHP